MFQPADAALIRAASYPRGLILPPWPDLTDDGQPGAWLEWLDQAWALPGFAAAVASAAPELARQVIAALGGEPPVGRRLRRVAEATARYLLRWTTRATPFGLFAGVAPVGFGPRALVSWGEQHHAAARPDEGVIDRHAAIAEQDMAGLRDAAVMTNSLGYRRGGKWVLPCVCVRDGRVQDAEAGLTGPVRLAVETAGTPVMFTDLAGKLTAAYPAAPGAAERLLAALVRGRILLSGIRPPMTVTDPASYLARRLAPSGSGQTATDLRIDCTVTLPPAVTREACEAASALAAVAPPSRAWAEYHCAFLERWGPGAAVPLREVLRILGLPAGYMSSPRRVPSAFTARDALLAGLAQRAALDGCAEVILSDDLITGLCGGLPPVPHTELRFTLAAGTLRELDRGAFTLTVAAGARHAGVAAGRFLHLLNADELKRFRRVYANLPAALPDGDTVQLSAVPLETRLASLARVPELLPVLPAGDFHPDPPRSLADMAVAADGHGLWLTSLTTGRPVEPLLLNAVQLDRLQHPLARFLTEIWTAFTAAPARFDWGHSRNLPFLPRIRKGRSILHPARWTIPGAALPGRGATWKQWLSSWERHREQLRLPRAMLLGDGDERLRLDLEETAHLAILRSHLDRREAVLTEAPGPAGWLDGRPAELLLTLISTAPRRAPRPARPATTVFRRPGQPEWIEARLHGRCDDILARLDLPDGWWYIRYPDPEPHLRLRIPLRTPGRFTSVARDLARQADRLQGDGLLSDCVLRPYRPETRHGTGPVLAAAEAVFAADSRAALRALARPGTDRQAATAAGMIAIADGFTGDGMNWLATSAPRHAGPRLDKHQLTLAVATRYADDELTAALRAYRALADNDGLDPDRVLADLLHLHHARMIGPGTDSERHCLRLARATALTHLARRTS